MPQSFAQKDNHHTSFIQATASPAPTIDKAALDLLAAATRAPGGDLRGEAAPPRMRSSIACVKCRRSKVKCLNAGPGTPCRACQTNGRECIYPDPVTDRSHRRDNHDRSGDGPLTPDVAKSSRSKVKKIAPYGSIQSSRPLIDALDPAVLTLQVWLDLVSLNLKSLWCSIMLISYSWRYGNDIMQSISLSYILQLSKIYFVKQKL